MNLMTAEEVRRLMPETVEHKVARLLERIKEEAKKGADYFDTKDYGLDNDLWMQAEFQGHYGGRKSEEWECAKNILQKLGFTVNCVNYDFVHGDMGANIEKLSWKTCVRVGWDKLNCCESKGT